MVEELILSAEAVGLFCRLNINSKRELPIRPSEMGVLIFTQKQCIPVTPLMISNFFQIAKPTVTSMVNSLIKQDYLTKTPSSIDRRSYFVSITDKGKELVTTTFEEYYKNVELLKKEMGGSEFNQLIALIQKANDILIEVK